MIKREKYLFILLSSVFQPGSCRQRIDYKGIKVAVRKVSCQSVTDRRGGNIEACMPCCVHSGSLQFDGHGGPAYGWEQGILHYKKTFPDKISMGCLSGSQSLKSKTSAPQQSLFQNTVNSPKKTRTSEEILTLLFRKTAHIRHMVYYHFSSKIK